MSGVAELFDFKRDNYETSKKLNKAFPGRSSDLLNKQDLLSVMAKLFQTKVFVVDRYTFYELLSPNPFSKKDECLKMEVTVSNNRGTKEDHHFIVKRLSSEMVNSHDREMKVRVFLKETELYSTVFPDFDKFEKDGKNRWRPQHYLSKRGKVLVLEDLTARGYYQIGRRECLDKEHILAVIRTLAAFHSASIKLEEKLKAGNLQKAKGLFNDCQLKQASNVVDVYSHLDLNQDASKIKYLSGNYLLEASIRSQMNLLDQLPGYSREEMLEIRNQLPGLLRKIPHLAKPSAKYRNVFVHGDLNPNNIFFRRNGNNLEAVLVDYQMVSYAPPAYDLIMLLYWNQRMAFRMKESQTLIQTYYNMFSEELSKNNICIQAVLPVKDYLESCEEFTEWGTLATLMYLQMNLLSDDVIKKYLDNSGSANKSIIKDRNEMITECFRKDEVYRTRMTEAMNDLIKKCVLLH